MWRRRPALFRMADAPATRACTLMAQATVWVSSHHGLVLNHLSWQSHVSSGILVLRQTLCKIKVYVFKDKGVSIITKKWSQWRKAIQRTGKNVEHYKFH